MAIAALEQLRAWGVSRVAATLSQITAAIAERAGSLGLPPLPTEQRGPHLLGVKLPSAMRSGVVQALAAADCYAAVRGETLRLAPHLHVTDADIECLIDALTVVMTR